MKKLFFYLLLIFNFTYSCNNSNNVIYSADKKIAAQQFFSTKNGFPISCVKIFRNSKEGYQLLQQIEFGDTFCGKGGSHLHLKFFKNNKYLFLGNGKYFIGSHKAISKIYELNDGIYKLLWELPFTFEQFFGESNISFSEGIVSILDSNQDDIKIHIFEWYQEILDRQEAERKCKEKCDKFFNNCIIM